MDFALFDFLSAGYTAEFLFFPKLSQKERGAGYTQMWVLHGGIRYLSTHPVDAENFTGSSLQCIINSS